MTRASIASVGLLIALTDLICGQALADPWTDRDKRAPCEELRLVPAVITPEQAAIPASVGVVVGWQWAAKDAATSSAEPLRFKGETGRGDQRRVAPGVFVVLPNASSSNPHVLLAGDVVLGTFTFDRKVNSRPPSKVPVLNLARKNMSQGPNEPSSYVSVEVTVDELPPDEAVGVVTYASEGTKPAVPISFQRLYERERTFYAYADPPRCAMNPAGMRAPTVGERIAIRWIDAYGNLSPLSNETIVKQ